MNRLNVVRTVLLALALILAGAASEKAQDRTQKCEAARKLAAAPPVANPSDQQLAERIIATTVAEAEVCHE